MEKFRTYMVKSSDTGGVYFTDSKISWMETGEVCDVEITIPEEILKIDCSCSFMESLRHQILNSVIYYDEFRECVMYYYKGLNGETHKGLCEVEILEKVVF